MVSSPVMRSPSTVRDTVWLAPSFGLTVAVILFPTILGFSSGHCSLSSAPTLRVRVLPVCSRIGKRGSSLRLSHLGGFPNRCRTTCPLHRRSCAMASTVIRPMRERIFTGCSLPRITSTHRCGARMQISPSPRSFLTDPRIWPICLTDGYIASAFHRLIGYLRRGGWGERAGVFCREPRRGSAGGSIHGERRGGNGLFSTA